MVVITTVAYKVVTGSTMYVGRVNTTKAHIHQSKEMTNTKQTRMWANAQPDGPPAEHRWRPLLNAAKFG